MQTEPITIERETQRNPSPQPEITGRADVVRMRDRRQEFASRQSRRALVERATVREYWGRSWEQDHFPATSSGLFGSTQEWQRRA